MSENPSTIKSLEQFVLVRPVRTSAIPDGLPVGSPTDGGFVYDDNLRCRKFDCVSGVDVGMAMFDFVPIDSVIPSIESLLTRYSTDDQVRVIVKPLEHAAIGSDLPGGTEFLTVFEGKIEKLTVQAAMNAGSEDESFTMIARPMPVVDNLAAEHLVVGRWMLDPAEDEPKVIIMESLDIPPVFNFAGRPNMSATDEISHAIPGAGVTVTARVFTHDDDVTAEYWTPKEAIKSLLLQWLFGHEASPAGELPRNVDLDRATIAALIDPAPSNDPRWRGLEVPLPEVDVLGLGYLDALQAVCAAGGFELQVMPHYGLNPEADRLYVFSINRINAGPAVRVGLLPRGAFALTASNDPVEVLRHNHVSKFTAARDAAGLRNEVLVAGRSLIEAAYELKPLWLSGDVTIDTTVADYAKRHVHTGEEYGIYQHVGRHWGIDCTGELRNREGVYTTGPYAHDEDGFDFVAALQLNGEGSPLLADRTEQGITSPIRWSRRLRHLLPLRRQEAQALGIDFVIEVSEDGGDTWTWLPTLRVRTLREQCGLQLIGVEDLSKINAASFGPGKPPAALEASWWKLIFPDEGEPTFRIRVTCCVAADHAAAGFAPRQASSGSVYLRRIYRPVEIEEVWASPQPANYYEPESLELIPGWGVAGEIERVEPVTLAERMRDVGESVGIPATMYTWRMDFPYWALGQRVERLEGRNLELGVNVGDALRHPSIVGIYVDLSGTGKRPDEAQGVTLALSIRTLAEAQR